MSKAPAKRPIAKAPQTSGGPVAVPSWLRFLDRHARVIALAAILLSTGRIAATYRIFSHTFDEPTHIACGMEWLDRHSYTWEPQHPPLARVAAALGPYLLGRHTHKLPNPASKDPADNKEHEGLAILYEGHQYERTLTAARIGILPFFWIACAVVWTWTRRSYGGAAAALAVAIFSFIPPVLAHAGLATTDIPVTAFTGAAFLCGLLWLERPDALRSILLGAAVALAVVSKFSSLAFLPATAGCAFLAWWMTTPRDRRNFEPLRRALPMLGLAAVTSCVLIWAVYRFSFAGVPAPQLFQGISDVMAHNAHGHLSYFMGELSQSGWWYYFPVMLGLKTPLALLLLLLLRLAIPELRTTFRRLVLPLAFSAAVLLVGMAASINIGVRHILPVYIGLAIVAAVTVVDCAERLSARKWVQPMLAVLAIWFAGSSLLAHPDYIPYFNELAGSEPEKIVVDSDLEWGQDLTRLRDRLRALAVPGVTLVGEALADFREQGFPPISTALDGYRPPSMAIDRRRVGPLRMSRISRRSAWASAWQARRSSCGSTACLRPKRLALVTTFGIFRRHSSPEVARAGGTVAMIDTEQHPGARRPPGRV